jgi:hypothetical protein
LSSGFAQFFEKTHQFVQFYKKEAVKNTPLLWQEKQKRTHCALFP